jgi:hypothetical protein
MDFTMKIDQFPEEIRPFIIPKPDGEVFFYSMTRMLSASKIRVALTGVKSLITAGC